MELIFSTYTLRVIREKGDPKFYGKYNQCGGWGSGESKLMHHIKKKLITMGYDVIKKRMWKDGHMMGEEQQYIRTRKTKGEGSFYIYDSHYSIRNLAKVWNKNGEIVLQMVWNIGGN